MMDHGQNGAILLGTLLKNDVVMNYIKKTLFCIHIIYYAKIY
jgi:hypothetical protein